MSGASEIFCHLALSWYVVCEELRELTPTRWRRSQAATPRRWTVNGILFTGKTVGNCLTIKNHLRGGFNATYTAHLGGGFLWYRLYRQRKILRRLRCSRWSPSGRLRSRIALRRLRIKQILRICLTSFCLLI